ncbi:CopG family transcriptional regulator [Candidatus Bathyarchaeota archaeon]|nr:CopG family transcriptional regulator [Candidatus Bathyarchaeota archaeon]
MSATFTIRIPRDLKERMKRLPVKWSEEIRLFIEERVKQLELMRIIEDVELKSERRRLRVDSTRLIREDREQ